MSRQIGKVKWFNAKRGYGFIIGPSNQDVFVHYSHIKRDGFKCIDDGAMVEYTLGYVQGKGFQARDVVQIDDPAAAPKADGFVPYDPAAPISDEEAARRAQQH